MNRVIPVDFGNEVHTDATIGVELAIPEWLRDRVAKEASLAGVTPETFMTRCIAMGSMAAEMVRAEEGEEKLPPCDVVPYLGRE